MRRHPKEIFLNAVAAIVDVHTRVSDLYSSPYDQIGEQLRLTIETVKERQESELINNPDYGMFASVADSQRISTLTGPPSPDDLDVLITRCGRNRRSSSPTRKDRGLRPGVHAARRAAADGEPVRVAVPDLARPADHPVGQGPLEDGKTKFLLLRTGEKRQGVVGLFQPGLTGSRPGAVGAVHGDQPERDRVLPDLAVLLAGAAHRRRAGGAG